MTQMTHNEPTRAVPYLDSADKYLATTGPARRRGAVGIVVNNDGEILLNLRDRWPDIAHPNKWSALGGVCEESESEQSALVRELAEEAALKVTRARPFRRLVDREGSGDLLTAFIVPTRARLSDLVLREGQDIRFFMLPAARRLDLVPFMTRLLAAYLEVVEATDGRLEPPPSPGGPTLRSMP
jgi:8-oxo-dGTP pyrophosphatase MutT (NUDIX family)